MHSSGLRMLFEGWRSREKKKLREKDRPSRDAGLTKRRKKLKDNRLLNLRIG